ncbi:SDR family NAD(P)-dependent oxidoreductase [Sphaerisporangium sp. NPDC088356]|uniref:SDR family NAD(P)-dependent oxidoreductase n=1 Tax=Sphaerisporangium sp. NPDC088356 TaxID=3154871 RepID=UPI00342D9A75
MRLAQRAAIVTGAAQGIGRATARRLAEEGASVLLVDVDESAQRVAADITSAGGTALFVRGDVSDEKAVTKAVQAARDTFGRLDVLVNNAAMTLPKGLEETAVEEWDRVQAVNLRSVYLFMKAAAPHLRESDAGSVVNVASFHASATIENFAAYAAAKSGVVGLTRSSALDLAPAGVRVNAVCPGIIETAMWQAWLDEVEDVESTVAEVLKLQPLGRVGLPVDVANAILFLASDESAYITGTTLYVDGGVTARLSHV